MTTERPYTLVAELTYRCPLRCGYCSNPVDHAKRRDALDAASWGRLFSEAAGLGVLAAHLTGGEPLLRSDLEAIVSAAHESALFTTLVTSGAPLDRPRLTRLRDAGLAAIQLSLQDADGAHADTIAGGAFHARKLEAARLARALEVPLTINVVLHRGNLARIDSIVELAVSLGAERLELANVQMLGSALAHRDALLPARSELDDARRRAERARARLAGRMDVIFVLPDYFRGVPRACMDGWARRTLVVTPDGAALPCHAARGLPGLPPPSVHERSLADIWNHAPLFRAFRGEAWMQEPCRTCERRAIDFGGCRCQAFALTGDARAADPACARSPHHALVEAAHEAAAAADLVPIRRRR